MAADLEAADLEGVTEWMKGSLGQIPAAISRRCIVARHYRRGINARTGPLKCGLRPIDPGPARAGRS